MRGMLLRLAIVGVSCLIVVGHEVRCPAAAQLAASQQGVLARIPAGTQFYVYTANVAALEAKIRLMENQMNSSNGFDPLASLMRTFGPTSGINFNRPAAIAVLSWLKHGAMMVQPSVAAFLASSKPAATLAAFGAKSVGHGIYQGSVPQRPIPLFMAMRGHYLILSDQAATVRRCLAAKTFLGPQLSPTQRHFLNTSDLAISLRVGSMYQMYRQQKKQMKMMEKSNAVGKKKVKAPLHLTSAEFYTKALNILAVHALHQMIAQVPQVMLTVRFARTGILWRLIAIPQPGTAMAELIQAQRPLGQTPFAGLPAGRYTTAGAVAINGAAVAVWLHRTELVWEKHPSIRSDKQYPQLKKQMAQALDALADLHGLSQISYAGKKPVGPNGLGIQVVHIAHAGMHLQQILTWLKHPTGLPRTGSQWAHARWTVTPAALNILAIQFTKIIGTFPPESKVPAPSIPPSPPSIASQAPSPQSVFGSNTVRMYAGAVGNRIIFADARAAGKLPQVVEQIQKHQQNLPQLMDIAELTAWVPARARLLLYLPLARWASLARPHPGTAKPVVGAVVIGAPVPPLLVSGSVVGGCLVYRAYMTYSLMKTCNRTSLPGLLGF